MSLPETRADLRNRPPLSLLVCCIAPLAQDQDGMESALLFAEAGLPVGFMSMANAGSTGPATMAGTLVAGDAEIVSALVLIQMAIPGAPVFHSLMPGIMHPHTGAYQATAWEGTLLYPWRGDGASLGRANPGRRLWHRWPGTGLAIGRRRSILPDAVRAGRSRNRQRLGSGRSPARCFTPKNSCWTATSITASASRRPDWIPVHRRWRWM